MPSVHKTRRKPSEVQLNVDIDKELAKALDEYAKVQGVSRKLAVGIALRRFLVSERALLADKKMRGK